MKIGYAMFSARELTSDPVSMKKVLKELADMGYQGVEFFMYNGMDPIELKETLSEYGLEAIGTHVHKPRWDQDTQGEIDFAVQAGIKCLVYPWIAPEQRTDSFYTSLPPYLEELAARCNDSGIELHYHNHDFEYEKLGEDTVMSYLLASAGSVHFELDTFWAQHAGINVVEYMGQLGNRISRIHVKDYMSTEGEFPLFCAIGTGKLDNTKVILEAKATQKEWLIVELDNSPLAPLESAKISIDKIKEII